MSKILKVNPLDVYEYYEFDFDKFQKYINHCETILESYINLLNPQTAKYVTDVQFMQIMNNEFGISRKLAYKFQQGYAKFLANFPYDKLQFLKSNEFCKNSYASLTAKINSKDETIKKSKFYNIVYSVISDEKFDENKFYTIEEIAELVKNDRIKILESFTDEHNLEDRYIENLIKGKKFVNINLGMINSKNIKQFDLFESDFDKFSYYLKNQVFCKFVRKVFISEYLLKDTKELIAHIEGCLFGAIVDTKNRKDNDKEYDIRIIPFLSDENEEVLSLKNQFMELEKQFGEE